VCSIDLTQLYAKLPINKINLKGFLDEHLVWDLPIDSLKDGEHQYFLQSPIFSLSSVSGKISIKLAVHYNQINLESSQQDGVSRNALLYCQLYRLTPVSSCQPTEYTIAFEYSRFQGKPPVAFEIILAQGKIYRPRVDKNI
jgi:hypothetical protein